MSDKNDGINDNELPEDERHLPELVPSHRGRMVSIRGLVERIIEEFEIEHGENESEAVQESTSEIERRKLLRSVADYIFSVESVHLELKEQAQIIARSYSEIFGYGALDTLFSDKNVTTITLEGARKAAVRYQPGTALIPLEPLFEDTPHMRKILKRLLKDAGAQLRDDVPIIETGLTIEGRRVCLTIAASPFVSEIAVDIRVHPKELPTLDMLVESGVLTQQVRQILESIVKSGYGFIIVGDTESGKTTLLSVLAQLLPSPEGILAIERASELALPDGAERLMATWPVDDDEWFSFGERIKQAIEKKPQTLILDEVRTDEPESIAPLLHEPDMPRQIWSFRGASSASRIRSALGMIARMSDHTQPESMVFNLYERLPFIIRIKRRKGYLQVLEIAEWQFPDNYKEINDLVYADYISLMEMGWEICEPTGKRPKHDLGLPEDFWDM
ncbi:MAG: ATPase, T2SS/T4P/T4SS family [Anaerolineae bacterium]|nr:ATPase, T2SS/T4P/T4SS family [Anaerolineae bacterium]